MKQTEIGMIPDDWEVKELGEIGKLKAGMAYDFKKIKNGLYPCFGGNGIRAYIDSYLYEGIFPIIGRQGELCGNVSLADGRFYATEHAVVMKPNKEIDSIFLYYKLIEAKLNQYATGCAQPGLSVSNISKVSISLPPTLAEQQTIAKALSDVDNVISTLEKLITKKKNLKQGTMQQLLTGKKRLPGFAKSDKFKQTEIGEIPEDWEVKELGEVCEINPKNFGVIPDEFVYIDLESVSAGKLEKKQIVNKKNAPSRAQRLFSKFDILYQTVRPYQKNNLFISFDSDKFVASTGYAIIRANRIISDENYIYQIIHTDKFVSTVLDNCTGTSYPAINPKVLKTIKIALPSKPEQTAIANVLSSMDKEIEALESKLGKYMDLKTGIMQQLLTGKIRLR